MRGSIRGQTLHLLSKSGVHHIGESRFKAKDCARMALAGEGRGGNSANIATKTGLYSNKTTENYLGKWQELFRDTKKEYGIKDLEKLTGDHIREFLTYKIELGVSLSHWNGYASAFGKLEQTLNRYSDNYGRGNSYSFRGEIEKLRPEARAELPRFTGTRNYDEPRHLIASVGNQVHQLVADIQLESGLRIAGATSINASQLRGVAQDAMTGKMVGQIDYTGKGGKLGTAQVSTATYQKLSEYIREHGDLKVGADVYRNSLREASRQSGQDYNGSHGLRWNYAQERFTELQATGASYEKCLGVVSGELGHNRIEITKHYLGL